MISPSSSEHQAAARAHANIALAKYWGKADSIRNLPATPSLSLTLEGMSTLTEVEFSPAQSGDELWLDGSKQVGKPLERAARLLDSVRALAGSKLWARVRSRNDFPTASGLASSASGFAALALAAARALGLTLSPSEISALARAASASAARSVFGGYVELRARGEHAEPLLPGEAWPLHMLVAVTSQSAKDTASTDGMQHTASTSPYYGAWVDRSPGLFAEIKSAILSRDFERLAPAVEQSALMMHASMLAARPALLYFKPATIALIECVRELRRRGSEACFTIDAGPHVKVLVTPSAVPDVRRALSDVPGVLELLHSAPGPDAALLAPEASAELDLTSRARP
jgi:diphosphomevalonate decarboxylase